MRAARYYLARILHECASNLAKLVVRQGFQRLLKKYDSPPSYRLASPHSFWHVSRAHALSTRATAMIAVASTRLTHQPGVILCTDALMPRRQESRTAMSPTRATCGLARPDRCLREEALRRRSLSRTRYNLSFIAGASSFEMGNGVGSAKRLISRYVEAFRREADAGHDVRTGPPLASP